MERRKAITRQDRNVCYGAETFSAFAEYEDNFMRTKIRRFFIVLAGRNIFTFLHCHVGNTNEIISNVLASRDKIYVFLSNLIFISIV